MPGAPKDFEEWKKLHNFYQYSDFLTKDLAIFLDVSPRTVQRWIKGTAKPTAKNLQMINQYLSKKSAEERKNPTEYNSK